VGSVVVSVVKFALELLDAIDNAFAEVVDITEEFVDGVIDSVKSGKVSLGQSLAEFVLECLKGGPGLSELLLESVGESLSDVGGEESKLVASGLEGSDELATAGWELAKEEVDGGNDLLFELFIGDAIFVFENLSVARNDLLDFFLDLDVINLLDGVDAWSGVLVLFTGVVWLEVILLKSLDVVWLETFTSGD
jgi:hypothetical protein